MSSSHADILSGDGPEGQRLDSSLFPAHLQPSSLRFQMASPPGDLWTRSTAAAHRALGRHSLVARCWKREPVAGLPAVSIHVARGPRRSPRTGRRHLLDDVLGMGVSDLEAQSWIRAVVEAVERYSMAHRHDVSETVRASEREVEAWAIPPHRFQLYSESQYRTIPTLSLPGPGDAIDWAWAYSITDARFVLVPAALIYGSVARRPPNDFIQSMMSTGMACHVSMESAILAGLLEVVERDAIMISWLNRTVPPRITMESESGLSALVKDRFGVPGIEFTLLDLTSDTGIPTVGCLALSDNPQHPASAMGAASRLDPVEAARKALFEAAQVLYAAHDLHWNRSEAFPENEVRTVGDHSRYYSGAAGASRLGYMVSSGERVDVADLGDLRTGSVSGDLAACVERLGAVGLDVLVVDLTPEDVARCGFHTVRVLVPGAVDMNGDVRFPHLGSKRIHDVPAAMGRPALAPEDLNLGPCPLA